MASLNITSLTKHIDELRVFMAYKLLDILAINETRLDPLIMDQEVHIRGYEIIRCDRNRSGGGCCLYVRSNIVCKLRADLVSETLECVCIEIFKPNSKPFLVATWYRPPTSHMHLFDAFETFVGMVGLIARTKNFTF